MPVVNDDLVTKFMTTMRQDQSGNTYSPHTQFKDIMSVSSSMKVEGTLMDDDFSLYEQQAFGNVYGGNNNSYNAPVVTNRHSTPINYNPQPVQQYPPQRIQNMNGGQGNFDNLPPEIAESMKKNKIDQGVFDHRLASNQQANYIVENTRMDLFESSVNPTPQMVEQPNISYNPNINESIQTNYQQPHVVRNNSNNNPNINVVPNSSNVDYSFINKIVKDAINEGLNNLNNPNSNKISLVKDGKRYSGKISQQKSGKLFFVIDGNDYVIELVMGDIKKIKK